MAQGCLGVSSSGGSVCVRPGGCLGLTGGGGGAAGAVEDGRGGAVVGRIFSRENLYLSATLVVRTSNFSRCAGSLL